MQDSEGSLKVTLDDLKMHISALRKDFPWEDVLNIYQWGSRVYGTATPQSDYDFVFVMKDPGTPRPPHLKENLFDIENDTFVVLEDDLVNATLIPLADWRLLLAEHRHEALECHFSPLWARWLERHPVPWHLDPGVLRRTVSWEARARLRTALNKLKAGDTYRGKKEVVHQLRYRMLALQILRTGRIHDFSCANEAFREILADESTNFQHYKEIAEQWADQLKEQLREEFGEHPQFYNEIETERKIWTWMEMAAKRAHFRNSYGINWIGDCGVLPRRGLTTGHATLYLPRLGSQAPADQPPDPSHYRLFELPRYVDVAGAITETVTIREFIDGLECFLYWHETAWVLGTEWLPSQPDYLVSWKQASSSSSTATWYSRLTSRTLERLFWDIWESQGHAFPRDTSLVYVFRIASEKHRRVTRYDDRLYLVYATDGAVYLDPEALGKQLGYHVPDRHSARTLEDLQRRCGEQSPFAFAGFSLESYGSRLLRASVHSQAYVMISLGTPHGTIASFNVRGSMDRVTLHELVRSEQVGVFLRAYPAWAPLLSPFQVEYESFLAPIEEFYQSIAGLADAEFAHAARSRWYHFVLFGARRYQSATIRGFFLWWAFSQFQKAWAKGHNLPEPAEQV